MHNFEYSFKMVTLKLVLPFLTAFFIVHVKSDVFDIQKKLSEDSWISASISTRSASAIKGHSCSIKVSFNSTASDDVILDVVGRNIDIAEFDPKVEVEEKSSGFNLSLLCLAAGNSPMHFQSASNSSTVVISNLKSIGFTLSCFRYNSLIYISYIVGWGYFAVWCFSMYPQIYMNVKNRSVKGYSFCYSILNTIGYFAYSVYNMSFYWSSSVHSVFFDEYPESAIPVKLNDVCFALHGFINCVCSLSQFYFFRATFEEKMPIWVKVMIGSLVLYATVITAIFLSNITDYFNIVEYLIYFSYIKIVITAVKYFPQAVMNFKRKSTRGFSIMASNADFIGSILSISQTITIAYNNDDWEAIWANPTKQALALLGIFYNIFYNFQHFILYRNHKDPDLEYEEILKSFENDSETEEP